jgi:hypothetical protein
MTEEKKIPLLDRIDKWFERAPFFGSGANGMAFITVVVMIVTWLIFKLFHFIDWVFG